MVKERLKQIYKRHVSSNLDDGFVIKTYTFILQELSVLYGSTNGKQFMINEETNDDLANVTDATKMPLADESVQEPAFRDLTEGNWLFIKHYLKTGKATIAYEKAGYRSKCQSAPYSMFCKLKKQIEAIGELEGFNKARLMSQINEIDELPLSIDKTEVTLAEKLRILKLKHQILNSQQEAENSKLSVFIINRPGKQEVDTSSGINVPSHINKKDVIDVNDVNDHS